jgi:hypothetical protein
VNFPPAHAPTPATAAAVPAPRLEPHEKLRLRTAAHLAKRLYPGPVGELVARELLTWEDFAHRLDQHGIAARLVQHVMTAPLPTEGAT